MTSNINPNNINGAYPVAGQDNNSQGFRDNFTNTSTNFQYAADEITDLQNNAVLKSALAGTTLNNNMLGSLLSNAQVQGFSNTVVSLGTLTGSVTIDYSAGSYQTLTTGGAISLAFSNFTAAGTQDYFILEFTVTNLTYTLTLPAAVGSGASASSLEGIQGLDVGTNTITFTELGTYQFQFTTADGGSTVYLSELTRPRNYFTAGIQLAFESIGNADVVSTAVGTSYIIEDGVATLADGAEGQVKTLIAGNVSAGFTIVTANAGWTGAGNITLSGTAEGCTLQYANSNWYCIGNNGASFS